MFWLVEWRHRSLVAPMGGRGGRNPFTGLTEACGVTGDTSRLPGRWTKPDSRGRRRPFANNMEGRTMLKSLDQPDVGAIPGLPRLMEYMTVEHGFVMVSVAFASGGARGRRSVRASRSTTRNAQKPNVTAGRSTVRSGRPSRSGNG